MSVNPNILIAKSVQLCWSQNKQKQRKQALLQLANRSPSTWRAIPGRFPLHQRNLGIYTTLVAAFMYSPNKRCRRASFKRGHRRSVSLDDTIQVGDASTGAHITTYRGHRLPAQTLSWSPDSRSIVSGSLDQTVQVWEATTGKPLLTYRGHSAPVTTVMWSPDGTRIASGSVDTTVQVWDATSGKTLLTFREHTKQVSSLAWSPDSTSIVSGSFDKTVRVWDASTGKGRYIYDGYNVAIVRIDNSKVVRPDLIFFVAWSHNGQRIAAVIQMTCSDDCVVVMTWDAQTGKQIVFYPDHAVYALAWSPEDTRFASAIEPSDVQIALVP